MLRQVLLVESVLDGAEYYKLKRNVWSLLHAYCRRRPKKPCVQRKMFVIMSL